MTFVDLQKANLKLATSLHDSPTLLLPVGACEQHGRLLPFATDTTIAKRFAEDAAKRSGDTRRLIVLPALPYGISHEHSWANGTISLSTDAFIRVIQSVCESASVSLAPAQMVIVNGHGGNQGALESVIRELTARTGTYTWAVSPLAIAAVSLEAELPDVHAAKAETSVMLFLEPDQVSVEANGSSAGSAHARPNHRDVSAVVERGVHLPWSSNDQSIARDGVIGDAEGANSALGEQIWASALEKFDRLLLEGLRSAKQGRSARARERSSIGTPSPAERTESAEMPKKMEAILELLRCPHDLGELKPDAEAHVLTCEQCRQSYPIVDDVALLVPPAGPVKDARE